MSDPHVHAPELFRKLAEGLPQDFFRQTLVKALTQVMEAEVSALCAAAYGTRTDERQNSRNGYRERELETRLGTVPLEIPRVRQGTYFPSFLEPRRRWEQAFVNVVSEAYVLGVSTRKVEELMQAMGAKGVTRSEVSRMSTTLDADAKVFRERPLDRAYPYIWLDALYVKVREGGRTISKAVLVATAVAVTGEREIIGVDVAAGEMESCWKAFLEALVKRGMKGVQMVISDAHAGLRKAIASVLIGTTWQRCSVHFLRNVLALLPRSAQRLAAGAFRTAFDQSNLASAKEFFGKAIQLLETKHPKAADCAREGEEDVLAYMSFPELHWRQIRSTNPLERLNREIRRRTDVIAIFPNDASLLRLVTMLLVEQHDEWSVGRRYFSIESMQAVAAPSEIAQIAAK
ncbi:MAG: IS256 family transposase [Pseudomonadota bacterium]|nr:IS256 family transposase [Pseudomonadota bacterium]